MSIYVDVVCGFRGAGKTTLIKRLAEELWEKEVLKKENIVFLQNESGRETLSQMSLRPGWQVKEIQTGCICCSGSQLLTQTLEEILVKYRPNRIILESSETVRIENLRMLLSSETVKRYTLDHILYVCNAKVFFQKMQISRYFLENELKQAPVIFLNHMEELTTEKRNKLRQTIKKINSDISIVETNLQHMSPEELQTAYDSGRNYPAYKKNESHFAYNKKNIMSAFAEFSYNE